MQKHLHICILLRRQNHFSRAAFFKLSPGCFENHLPKPAFEGQRFRCFCQIDRLAVQLASQTKRSNPFAGLVDRVRPAQLVIGLRLIA